MSISFVGIGDAAAADGAACAPTIPATAQKDDILVAVASHHGAATLSCSGWTKKAEELGGAAGMDLVVPLEMLGYGVRSATSEVTFDRSQITLDPADYDGATYYFEVVLTTATTTSYTISLVDTTNNAVRATIASGTTAVSYERKRSTAFTPAAGANTYKVRIEGTASASDVTLATARIVVVQAAATKTRLQFPLCSHAYSGTQTDTGGEADSMTGNVYGQTNAYKYSLFLKDTAKLATIASGTPWSLEGIMDLGTASDTASLALFNATDDVAVTGAEETLTGTTTPAHVAVDFADGAAGFTNLDDFEARIRCNHATRYAYLYRAELYVRLTSLTKALVYHVTARPKSNTNAETMPQQRHLYDADQWSSGTKWYIEGTASDASASPVSSLALRYGTGATGTGTTTLGTYLTFAAARSRVRSADIAASMVDGDDYMCRTLSSTGTLALAGELLIAEVAIASSATQVTVFWKRHDGDEDDPSITGASDGITARVAGFRGAVTTGDPWEVWEGPASGAGPTCVFPALTTATDGSLVFAAVASPDTNSWDVGGWGSLSTPNGAATASTLLGDNASLIFLYGTMATAGDPGELSAQQLAQGPDVWVAVIGALEPAAPVSDFNLDITVQVADEVWPTPSAVITGLSSVSGAVGSSVTIIGTDLGTDGVVYFGTDAATATAWSETAVTVTVPVLWPMAYAVTVVPTGVAASNARTYTITSTDVELTPTLFDGDLYVSIGWQEVTGDLLPGLRLSSTDPGGYGEALMRLPSTDPVLPYHPAMVRGATVVVIHASTVLFYGEVVNDISTATVASGEAFYDVAAAGIYHKASLRRDWGRVWIDSDTEQWFTKKTAGKLFELVSDEGVLSIAFPKGRDYTSGRGAAWYYWINNGIGPDDNDLDHVNLTLADYEGSGNGMDLAATSTWEVRFQTSTHPWGTWTKSRYFTADGGADDYSGPLAAGVTRRIPVAGSFPAGTKAVRMLLIPTSSATTTADRFVCGALTVYAQADEGLRVDEVMVDIATDTGLAASSSATAVGFDLTGDVVVRPPASHADGLEQIAALADDAISWGFWNAARFTVGDRATPVAADYTIDVNTPGIDYDVHLRDEGAPDYVRVLYKSSGHATYPNGTVLHEDVSADTAPPLNDDDASQRVDVLDLSEMAMGATQAAAIGEMYLARCGRDSWHGQITIHTPTVPLTAGGERMSAYIVAGQHIAEATHGDVTGPLHISTCDLDVDSATVQLTIGETAEEFKARVSGAPGGNPNVGPTPWDWPGPHGS